MLGLLPGSGNVNNEDRALIHFLRFPHLSGETDTNIVRKIIVKLAFIMIFPNTKGEKGPPQIFC